jgi:fibronectin-binding autotransporter adhesin
MDLVNRTKVLSRRTGTYVMISFFMVMIFLYASGAFAGPEGAQVINGQVSFQQSGLNTTITASNKAIINYTSFDIARPEIVEFIQPSSTASVLNRILSANPTAIDGTLLANGRVFFLNPAGVIIGQGARINVTQLVASALNMSNSDFINGRLNFAGGNGPVINQGAITAEKVYLIGKQVANSGAISCPAGYVVMASGDRVFIGEVGSDVVVEIDVPSVPVQPLEGAAVLNEGTVDVGSGTIVLAAAGDIYAQAISNVGTLSASTQSGNAGQIKLAAADGVIANTGSIEAKSGSAAGGVVSADGKAIVNLGAIDVTGAEGGQVALNATSRLGQFGTIKADGTVADAGEIDLWAGELDVVGDGSVTTANAGLNGNGGQIRVLADMEAGFAGLEPGATLQAKGGAESGDGGFIELSAHNFQTWADIDVSAGNGDAGTFLLDPLNITITNTAYHANNGTSYEGTGPGTVPPNAIFPDFTNSGLLFGTDAGLTDTVASGYVDHLLDAGNNVILQAKEDITINNLTSGPPNYPIQWGTTADLVLQAGQNITIGPFSSSSFIGCGGGGDIHIEAHSPHSPSQSGLGKITIGNNVEIGTRASAVPAGTVTLIGDDFDLIGTITTCAAATTVGTVEIGPATTPSGWNLSPSGILTNTELQHIRTGTLIIGEAKTAGASGVIGSGTTKTLTSITVDDMTGPFTFSTLHLIAGGIDDADVGAPSNLSVTNLILEAKSGSIGSAGNPLDIDVTNVDIEKGGLGSDVVLYDHSGGLIITDLGAGIGGYGAYLAGGNLTVTAASPITVNSDISAPGNITLSAGETGAAGDDLDINANITSTGGNVILAAGDDILLDTAGPYTIQSQQLATGIVALVAAYGDLDNDGSILGDQATIKATNITLQVAGTAAGTIGAAGTPILIDLGTGVLSFATGSATGDVYIKETYSDIYSSQVLGSTDPATAQTIYFENSSGHIYWNSSISTEDNLQLYTTGTNKNIIFTYSPGVPATAIQTTGNVTLDASGAIRDGITDSAQVVDIDGATITLNAAYGGIGTPATGTDGVLELTASTRLNADTYLGGSGDESDIHIYSVGDLPIRRVYAGTGDVYLTSTGNMTDARPGPLPNINGDKVVLTASTGIGDDSTGTGDLNTRINELEATTVTGDIYVTNDGGLIVGDTVPTVGATITAGSSATDNITITADSPLTINGLVSGPGNITLTAGDDTGNPGDDLNLNADVTSTGASTTIALTAGDSILQNSGTVSNTNAAGGTITATADNEGDSDGDSGGAVFTQSSGTSFVSNGGPITVSAYGNATLRLLDASGTTGPKSVAVTSTTGSIIDNRWRARPNIIGASAVLDAFTGVGSSGYGDINTDIDNLEARTATGGIFVTNDGALTIGGIGVLTGVQVTGSGDIVITAASPLTVAAGGPVSGPGNITLTAGDDLSNPGDDLTLNDNVTSTGAGTTITLVAGDSIIQNTGTVQNTNIAGGTIIATADNEGDAGDGDTAEFTQASGTSFVSGFGPVTGGPITVSAYGDVKLSLLNAWTTGMVAVNSTAGAITDNTVSSAVNIIGDKAVLTASTGIGTTLVQPYGEIATTINYLEAETQTGAIWVIDTAGGLTVGHVTGMDGVRILGGTGSIWLAALSPMVIDETVEGPGFIWLWAAGPATANDDLILNAYVHSTGTSGLSAIQLWAGDSISQTATSIVETAPGGTITAIANYLETGNGDGGTSGFTQADGAKFIAHDGLISVACYDNADLSQLDAGTTGAVQVTSTNGAINDNTAAVLGEAANIIGGSAELNAFAGIGAAGGMLDIETDIANLEAATVTGGIYVTDIAGGLTIGGIVPPGLGLVGALVGPGGGNIEIIANSPLTVAELVQGPGNITLTAGNDTVNPGDNLALNANVISTGTGTTIDLNAGDGISQAATSVVQITGIGTIDADADTEGDGTDLDLAGFTQADGASFVVLGAGSNVISVRSRGDAKLSSLNAGATGAVDVYSTNGAITDNTSLVLGEAANITGATAELKASTGIGGSAANADIDTTIANLEAATVTGGIYVTDTAGGLIIGGISPGVLGLLGAQIATPGAVTDNIVIIANSPLTVNELVQGPGNITLTAGDSTSTGDDLILNADVTSTGAGTTIALNAGDSILQNSGTVSNAGGGTIIATANTENDAGADGSAAEFTQADTGTSFVANGGQIYVFCYGDAKLSLLDEGSSTVVGVFSSAGAIMDNTGAENANIISYATLLDAYTGIGGSTGNDDIDTTTSLLAADTQTGGIYITNTVGLNITTVVSPYETLSGAQITGASGDIVITATSPLTVNQLVHGPANITLTAGDNLVAANDNLTLNANVTSDGGVGTTIALNAGDNISQTDSYVVQTNGGAINATAGTDGDVYGAFTQSHRASFVSNGGAITVIANGTAPDYRDVKLSLLDAGAGAVAVTTAGSIIDNRWGPRANIIGHNAVLIASTGIGSSGYGDINTQIDDLKAQTYIGGIYVTNDGALTIGNTDTIEGVQVTGTVVQGGGDIVIRATSPLTVDELVQGPANITLTAGGTSSGTPDDLTLNADVTSTGGAGTTIALNAGDSIYQNSGTVSTAGGAIVATADYGEWNGSGVFTQAHGTSFVSNGGPITVYSYGDATLCLLDAGSTGAVQVTSAAGSIIDNRWRLPNIIGCSADLDAYTGIGGTGNADLDTEVTWISADTINGDIGISNTNASDVTATSLTTGTGNIVFNQSGGGDLTVDSATTVDGDIDITVADADLIAIYVEAGIWGGTDDGDVTLTTTSSADDDVWVDDIRAVNDMITIDSAGAIMEYDEGPATDLTANEIYLYAWLGIYGGSPIETSAATVWGINWGNGDIDIHNTLASDASVFTWIFGTGNTRFVQDGGGNLFLIGALTNDGTIWVQVDDGGDLLAQGPCHISAGGTYYLNNLLHDSRESINFLNGPLDGRDPGNPFDLAVYLASTGGNVTVDMPVEITPNGALVIDAHNKVTFGDTFENNVDLDWMEVCSRITETLNQAAAWGTLPYVDDFGSGRSPSWFDGKYVLRGGLPDAWVLHWVNMFPWPPVITFEPGKLIAPPVRNFEPEKEGAPYMPAEAESCLDDAYLCSTDVLKP